MKGKGLPTRRCEGEWTRRAQSARKHLNLWECERGNLWIPHCKKPEIQILRDSSVFDLAFNRQVFQIYDKRTCLLKNLDMLLTHWLPELFAKTTFLFILVIVSLDMSQTSPIYIFIFAKGICNVTACIFSTLHRVLRDFCSGMCRNQFQFFFRLSFFSFSYLFAAVIDLLLGLLPV